jgi:type II restriction/modification system DNA methylase subunit YeeA
MDTSQLKKYATQARRDFRDAVSARARRIGVSNTEIQSYSIKGDLLIIGEQTFPKDYKQAFDALYREVHVAGFETVVDEIAYTWFNRFVALRFMELHDYFPHGFRVLSSTDEDPTPQILRNPLELQFTHGFNKTQAQELFEAGNKEEELYRMVLIAQCNELNTIMPFLFERVSDLSELLLPDNLLASDSVIRKLTSEIPESAWFEGVEIIGWIYQYYISEKKDEVIGKVVKSEDIPAATQLFTPNWIVKYLVQNSIGSYWLGTYPDSPLAQKMEYYIKPAEQEPEVLEELKKITPREINPETITVLDPACGSGHILVEAYDLLKEIYLERGYRPREVPRLILEKNLFGLDIDGRASQLASFALLMKARSDDKSIFSADHPVKLNILEIVEADFNIDEAVSVLMKGKDVKIEPQESRQSTMPFVPKEAQTALPLTMPLTNPGSLKPSELKEFLELFKEAKTFGSLIKVPEELKGKIHGVEGFARRLTEEAHRTGDLFAHNYGTKVLRICEQAKILGGSFDAVVANPPYMGNRYLNPKLKAYLKREFSGYEKDLFSAFIVHSFTLTKHGGRLGFMSPFVWMFISSYQELRKLLVEKYFLTTLTQLEYSGFDGATVPICTFTLQNLSSTSYRGSFIKLSDFRGAENQAPKTLEAIQNKACGWFYTCKQSDFSAIPGSPIAYWVSDRMRQIFREGTPLREIAEPRQGLATTDNNRFLRRWWECDYSRIGFNFSDSEEAANSRFRWFPYNKGGDFRKWYGNQEFVLDWADNGRAVKESVIRKYPYLKGNFGWVVKNSEYYFKPGITWTFISSSKFGVRLSDPGFLFDVAGSTAFPEPSEIEFILGLLCSSIAFEALKAVNPTLNFQVGNVGQIPVLTNISPEVRNQVISIVKEAVQISREDWDRVETSWNFCLDLTKLNSNTVAHFIDEELAAQSARRQRLMELETLNNRLFLQAYGLLGEVSPEVTIEDISLRNLDRPELIESLASYSIGCIVGRYSLDAPGLIYANSGNVGFDPSRYKKFPADADGVVPILDYPWFADDITTRFQEFLVACWGKDTIEENMKFVADSLGPKQGETPEETIRRYFCDDFFKNHLKMYKKRPIYWLFSSGKEKAFQALVYLHRYNEQTLSKMRTDYVLPLSGKMASEEKRLDAQIESAGAPAERNRFKKELEKLKKKQVELRKFDELLHHYADKRISLDLDDGVKVNYGKFGALLAEVKQVTGGGEE